MGAIKNAIFENVTAQIGGHALPKICQQLIFLTFYLSDVHFRYLYVVLKALGF